MASAAEEIFDQLNRIGFQPRLGRVTGTVRFDIVSGREVVHWLVTIERGNVRAERLGVDADCVVRADEALFEAIAKGRENAVAAFLRGALVVSGNPELLVLAQRLFPGPSGLRTRQPVTSGRR
jgi:predicted lipid carrier protein YhbT